ncbi:hypothetical protein CIB48_g9673 [Xylaria polymorpha]|nr:hypothetical protein CIB48_g9673 [Xylaria polymorpha]
MEAFSYPFNDYSSKCAPVRPRNSRKKPHFYPHRRRYIPRSNRTTSYESSNSTSPRPHYTHPTTASIARSFSASLLLHKKRNRYVIPRTPQRLALEGKGQQSTQGEKTPSTTSTTLTSVSRRLTSKEPKLPTAKVGDNDFRDLVLQPCGITIDKTTVMNSIYNELKLSNLHLNEDWTERVSQYKEKFNLHIWLESTKERLDRIKQEYNPMSFFKCNEPEFQAYALQNILLTEPRQQGLLQEATRLAPSEWDIRPDCTYYVSPEAFEDDHRPIVDTDAFVVQYRAFSPYLTIEFKKDNGVDNIKAQNQREEDIDQMRHYGIIFMGRIWEFWSMKPSTFEACGVEISPSREA